MNLRLLLTCAALAALAIPLTAAAAPPSAADATSTFTYTENMHPLGFSPREIGLAAGSENAGIFNSDLAFWGKTAVHGNYEGFRLVDISAPGNPKLIVDYDDCQRDSTLGNQGDISIWGNILTRSWNSNTPASGGSCDGEVVPPGFEGIHVFDISNPQNPDLVGSVDLACGSHTQTMVPDLENDRLLIYNGSSSGACFFVDIIEIPLDNPAGVNLVRSEPTGDPVGEHPCHDIAVILGDAMSVGCAGGDTLGIFSLDPADGGSLVDPAFLYHTEFAGVTIGHTAAFTWDGKYAIFGHEPGGGGQAQCQATSSVTNRTLFFVEVATGDVAGTFLHPRPQTSLENCTWHNLNVVPTDKGYILVAGNYQSGISVVDFTDPTNAKEIAYADPAPLVNPNNPAAVELGGDWSTYWYDGFIYEGDITRGVIVWNLSDSAVAGAKKLGHLNPQTQEFTIDLK